MSDPKPRRAPLDKQRFGEGNRQKWLAILIGCAACVLYVDSKKAGFNPDPYLTFLTFIGCVGIGTLGVDAYAKIRGAEHPKPSTPPDHGQNS